MSIHDLPSRVARAVRWHRRGLAALCAALAVLAALSASRPPAAATVAVVVAAHDLPAGHTLEAGDLTVADYPPRLAPGGAQADADQSVGRVLAAAVSQGSPVTASTTITPGVAAGPGELLVPFHVADPTVLSLVQVGDRVTVVAAGQDGQPITLATKVRVVSIPQASSTEGATGQSGQPSALVVVCADDATARKLAAWSGSQGLSLALG